MPESVEALIEARIGEWRSHLLGSRAIQPSDVDELEDHLREHLDDLTGKGLTADEAFLVAVGRMGEVDALSREFAREHSERLWKQLVHGRRDGGGTGDRDEVGAAPWWRSETAVVFALAVAAAVAVRVPELFGVRLVDENAFYALNASFFTLPFVTAYFVWKRRLGAEVWRWLAVALAGAAVVVNAYPYTPSPGADTQALTAIHLPMALWLVVGIAYAGDRWRSVSGRMDFVRFSGELFIYYVLIALGGGVLMGFTMGLFEAIGIDAESIVESWILPCGAVGAVVVASWLVEAKQSVIENMAPVLTRIFTPLFALVLLAFVATMAWTGRGIDVEREVLIAFDLLLVVVFGLLLYALSARDATDPPGLFDWVQVVLVVSALGVDLVALWAIGARITDFGFTPNRVAALGENLVLLANLGVSAVLYAGFLRGRTPFDRLVRWQANYLYVFAAWGAVVALIFPLIFGFR